MIRSIRKGHIAIWAISGLIAAAGVTGVGVWGFFPSAFEGSTLAEYSGEVAVPYDEFRTILVRNKATRAIVENDGMQLIEEEMIDFDLDLSNDRRPLLNALLRKSKASVTSQKRLVVAINNAEVQVDNLELIQNAQIGPKGMDVKSASQNPVGDLSVYETTLHAEPKGNVTLVRVTVNIGLNKKLSKFFHHEAQTRLDASGQQSVQKQFDMLEEFVLANAQ